MASIGIGLGPFFGGLLLEYFDWSSVFLLNVPVAFAAFVAGFWLVPDSRDPEPGKFDIPGMTLSMGSLLTLVYAVIEAPDRGWTDGRILGCFAVATVLAVAFAIRELRTESPMLNLSFFRNPRFSAASGGMSLAFFALFGATFAMTQFLQDAKGYSALQAGAAMIPLAGGLIVGAVTSVKVTERAGSKVVVAGGLAGLALLLASSVVWTPDMAYLPLGVWFFALAMALGWIAGPATASVMGAVPEEKAGVASAMNDVTRQVAGALGTAVIGSLITSGYASRVNDAVTGLPESAQVAAKDSIGQANAVAAQLPTSDAAHLMSSAANAFTDAMGAGFLIAAGCAVVAVIGVVRWLPARDLPRTAEVVPFPDARRDEREAA
jgi:predicted MFS family arabinose efflux permease